MFTRLTRQLGFWISRAIAKRPVERFAFHLAISEPRISPRDHRTRLLTQGDFSVCAWSGWSEIDGAGNCMINTHWLLSGSALDKEAAWAATKIGESTFQRVQETPDDRLLADDESLHKLVD